MTYRFGPLNTEMLTMNPLRLTLSLAVALILALNFSAALAEEKADDKAPKPDKDGYYSLFNGKTLDGWKASENKDCFKVEDGKIVVHGKRSHLFYTGPVNNAKFRNFEFKAQVLTKKNSNSGIYFHTEYQQDGWPAKGYECQVNNTYNSDPRKTGSLYAVKDNLKAPVGDDEWFNYHIIVKGKTIVIKINDKVIVEYTEPDDLKRPDNPGRVLSSGTFALQGHDPGSEVHFRDIKVKPLPDDAK